MTKFTTITKGLIVLPEGEPIFSERATTVELADEAAGLYVEVSQEGRRKIAIEPEEWPALRAAIDKMIEFCAQSSKN